jgi:opacity protein-like surface antigen
MTPKRYLLLSAGLGLLISGAAAAPSADQDGVYFGVSGGPQWRASASDSAGTTTFKTGFAVNGTVGYRLQAHRLEGEVSYFNNRCKTTDPAGPAIGVEPSSGSVDINALLANYACDLPLRHSKFVPFVGIGLGGYRVSINGLTTPSLRNLPAAWGGPVVVYAKSTWSFAYQVRAGVRYQLAPGTEILVGYRFLQGSDLDINLANGTTINPDGRLQCLEAGLQVRF